MVESNICANCKLRVGDYCFCGDEPDQLTDNPITQCDYFADDNISSYYEFIDGYEHCNKLKRIELNKRIKELTCNNCDGYEAGYSAGQHDSKRPQGKWILETQNTALGTFGVKNKVCSECRHITKYEYPFCPWCGAEMEREFYE